MKHFLKNALMLLAFILPTVAAAHDFEVDGIYYNINGSEATVTYSDSYYPDGCYTGNVIIPETVTYNGITYPVTAIGYCAFCSMWSWGKAINISSNPMYSIANEASSNRGGPTSVTIPNSIKYIGEWAFLYCTVLTNITIPNSVTDLGNEAFYGCSGLLSVTIGTSINTISDGAFSECTNLSSVIIPNSVISIGNSAFGNCTNLLRLTIPNSVISIGNAAFSNCRGLTDLTIPNSVNTIGDDAFYGCSGLTNIYISNSVSSIGNSTFCDCVGLRSITIPNSVNTIGDKAFKGCIGLTGNLAIPNSVTVVGNHAFSDCSSLTSVSIGNSVTTIGSYAFNGCSGLTGSISFPKTITYIGGKAFNDVSAIESIICMAETPPAWDDIAVFMPNVYNHTPLFVPSGSLRAYQADQCWGRFANIIEIQDNVLATGISLNQSKINMIIGYVSQLIATVLPENASNKMVSWASSDTSVAVVDANGLVTAVAPGIAAITAITTDGSNLSASCLVTVSAPSLKGDVDEDGEVSISDVSALIEYLLTGSW